MTKFAALLVKVQFKPKANEQYEITPGVENQLSALKMRRTKTAPGKEYLVDRKKVHLECDC